MEPARQERRDQREEELCQSVLQAVADLLGDEQAGTEEAGAEDSRGGDSGLGILDTELLPYDSYWTGCRSTAGVDEALVVDGARALRSGEQRSSAR